MGGHGGLNILPQKKWNVYNRDNRLKVARDEAAYEQQQQDLAEKHHAAEREHRRLALKERARQRHGGAATINLDALEAEKYESLEQQQHYTRTQLEHAAEALAAPRSVADPMLSLEENPKNDDRSRNSHPSKRQKRDERAKGKKVTKKQATSPPSLAELAHQLENSGPPPPTTITDTTLVNRIPPLPPPKVQQHINLFAEEEARAKNPEKAAEQRASLSKRGDEKTRTTDAKFDESFQLGYGLGGGKGSNNTGSVPWYAQHPSQNLTGAGNEDIIVNRKKNEDAIGVSAIEKWKEQGTAALRAAADGNGNGNGDEQKKDKGLMLLKGVKLIPSGETESVEEGKKEKKGRNRDRGDERKREKKKKKKEKKSSRTKESKDDPWSKLREERLRREQEEQKRQNEAVRAALHSDKSNHGSGGRHPRYFSTYGHGK